MSAKALPSSVRKAWPGDSWIVAGTGQFGVDALIKAIKGGTVDSLIDSGAGLVTPDVMDSDLFKGGGN